jgi:putative nucleotidyltransferase with HDIG domain
MPNFYMMVGIVGSGKSTVAESMVDSNTTLHSSDEIREELLSDINRQDSNDLVFAELHKRVKNDLIVGKNTIFDATNISYKKRMAFLQELKNISCQKICIFMATPYEQCLEQNKLRNRVVPEHVIKKMYTNMDVPAYFEGWDDILIRWNCSTKFDTHNLFKRLDVLEHNNPHHRFTVGVHCESCFNLIDTDDNNLRTAAYYHDIGKEFTKQFKDSKGEDTEIAHYYNHMNVSAYDVMFYIQDKATADILDICQLIRWHMQPFFMESEKSTTKFINLVGKQFYDRLMILHEADRKAH